MQKTIYFIFFCLLSATVFSQSDYDLFIKDVNAFYSKYVENNLVNYGKVQENKAELIRLTVSIADFNLAGLSDQKKIAFYINAYNLTVIKSVIDKYPVTSPSQITGLFDQKKHQIARVQFTLNELEHEKLFKFYNDPRYHFVLVCAARGCPPILNKAYQAETLEQQLHEQTTKALNDFLFINVDPNGEKVKLSQIFNWYAKDFKSEGTVIDYINQYREEKIPTTYKVSYYEYDWSLNDHIPLIVVPGSKNIDSGVSSGPRPTPTRNLQSYTPDVLLSKGQMEGKIFNNLYTQNKNFDSDSKKQPATNRSNFFTSNIQFNYGISPRINVGADLVFRSVSNRAPDSSPLDVFRFQNNNDARTGVTEIGLRAKYAPFNVKGLSFQTVFYLPTGKRLQGDGSKPFIDWDATQWFQQFFYGKNIGDKVNLFGELGFITRIDTQNPDAKSAGLTIPFKLFPSFFITDKFTVYGMTEYAPTIGSWFYVQSGLGAKYQLTNHFEVEVLYTNFWIGKNTGAGQTYNLGLRYLY